MHQQGALQIIIPILFYITVAAYWLHCTDFMLGHVMQQLDFFLRMLTCGYNFSAFTLSLKPLLLVNTEFTKKNTQKKQWQVVLLNISTGCPLDFFCGFYMAMMQENINTLKYLHISFYSNILIIYNTILITINMQIFIALGHFNLLFL